MNPTISIIVPVYNNAPYLRKCLDSILAQTITNIEVIIINDGSTDHSGVICDEYAGKDDRVKVIHQENRGISSTRNLGVARATGEYIGFVDGDDYITMNMYKKMHEACVETGSNIAICKLGREINGELINNNIGDYYTKKMSHEEAMRELFKGVLYRFSLCNKLFKKECFDHVVFPEGRIHEDLSTTYRLFANATQAVYLNVIGYVYVKQKDSILTSSYDEKRLDAFTGWDEIISFMQQEYPQLSKEVMECFVYSAVDHSYYILDQVKEKTAQKKYLYSVQISIRKHYKAIRKSVTLSLTYQCIITIINYSIYLFVIMNRLKRTKRQLGNIIHE